MCQVYDISTHILLFKQFSLMNAILKQNKYEETDLNKTLFYDKINIGDNLLMEKINNYFFIKFFVFNFLIDSDIYQNILDNLIWQALSKILSKDIVI